MPYKPLVTAWHDSRVERTELQPGQRVASMEHDLLATDDGPADMSPGRDAGWLNLFGLLDTDPQADEPGDGAEVQA